MVQTRNSDNSNPPNPIATQLAAIAAKLEAIETMKEDIAALKEGDRSRSKGSKNFDGESSWRGRQSYRPYNKIDFLNFSGGDPRGWLLKAEKYFRRLPNFGPTEFQNPDDFLCSIKQTRTIQEYQHEFAKRSSRVSNWPDHCLLGVFLNGLKDELKPDVLVHKPHTVYSAMSLALEFESKLTTHRPTKNASWTLNSKPSQSNSKPTTSTPAKTPTQPKNTFRSFKTEKQNRFLQGECFRCGDITDGTRCKTGTFKVLEANKDVEESFTTDLTNLDSDREETAEISLHAIFGKKQPTHEGSTAVMNDLFRPYLRSFILVFFDEILVYSSSMEQHNLKGVSVEDEKISAVKSWPIPSTVKEVIARPLTALTKKDEFLWSKEALKAFNDLKQVLLTTPILRLLDFSEPFVIECDASSDGVGAILSQEDHPIDYFSKGFSLSNHFKSAYDRELRTDHYTLKFLLEQRITSAEQQRLLLKLMPYDFSIVHKAGKENKGARLQTDSFTSELIMKLQTNPSFVLDFSLVDQLLFHHGRMVILEIHNFKLKLLQEAHDTLIGGHGVEQFPTFRLEDKTFYYEGSNDKDPPLKVYSRRKDRSRQDPSNGILKKIDRVLRNIEFMNRFTNSHALFLPHLTSDHNPSLLIIPKVINKKNKAFSLGTFLKKVIEWKEKLQIIQKQVDQGPHNATLKKQEAVILKEYNTARKDEEKLLF
ncbi:retrotransposon gag domain, retroviral aspartyl protease [Tanacetum coccineum]